MKLRITQGVFIQEVTLQESPPTTSPYLVITYNQKKYYARLSTNGSGICINGLFTATAQETLFVPMSMLDIADVETCAPITISVDDSAVTQLNILATMDMRDEGIAQVVGIPKATVDDEMQVDFPTLYVNVEGTDDAGISCTIPLYIEASDIMTIEPASSTDLSILDEVTTEFTLIG